MKNFNWHRAIFIATLFAFVSLAATFLFKPEFKSASLPGAVFGGLLFGLVRETFFARTDKGTRRSDRDDENR